MSTPISLCLSGGGFRATLFHLGVITALRDLQMLPNLRDIYSVSGGSILAAHMTLNWEDYSNRNDSPYYNITQELISLVSSDFRGRLLRRWLSLGVLPRYGRTQQLIREYGLLYGNKLLQDLAAPTSFGSPPRPKLHILATSFVDGACVEFNSVGFRRYSPACWAPVSQAGDVQLPGVPVALAVAASSAFPPLFPPVPLVASDYNNVTNALVNELLTDGGIFGNRGVHPATQATDGSKLIVSDASAVFPADLRTSSRFWYRFIGPRTIRSTDILMNRVAVLEANLAESANAIAIRISDLVRPEHFKEYVQSLGVLQAPSLQQELSLIRTDLNRFSSAEIRALHRHGYELGIARLSELTSHRIVRMNTWIPTSSKPPHYDDFYRYEKQRREVATLGQVPPEADYDLIRDLEPRRESFWLWDSKDPISLLLALEVLVAGGIALVLGWAIKHGLMTLWDRVFGN